MIASISSACHKILLLIATALPGRAEQSQEGWFLNAWMSFTSQLSAVDTFILIGGLLGLALWVVAGFLRKSGEKKNRGELENVVSAILQGPVADVAKAANVISRVTVGGPSRWYLFLRDTGIGLLIASGSAYFVDRNVAEHGNKVLAGIANVSHEIGAATQRLDNLSGQIRQNAIVAELSKDSSSTLMDELFTQIINPHIQYVRIDEVGTLTVVDDDSDTVLCGITGSTRLVNKHSEPIDWSFDLYLTERKDRHVARFKTVVIIEKHNGKAKEIVQLRDPAKIAECLVDRDSPDVVHLHTPTVTLRPLQEGYAYEIKVGEEFTEPINGGRYSRQTRFSCSEGMSVKLTCGDSRVVISGGYGYPTYLLPEDQRPVPDVIDGTTELRLDRGLFPGQGVFFDWRSSH